MDGSCDHTASAPSFEDPAATGTRSRAGSRQFVDDDLAFVLCSQRARGTISSAKFPLSCACAARRWLSYAKRSCSSRVRPSSVCDLRALRRHRHRKIMVPQSVVDHRVDQARRRRSDIPKRASLKRYGAFDIDSMPPAATTALASLVDRAHRVDDGEQARGAHFVDRFRRHRLCQTALEADLARGILPDARLGAPHRRSRARSRRVDSGALDRRHQRHGAEGGRFRETKGRRRAARTACGQSPETTALELCKVIAGTFRDGPKAVPHATKAACLMPRPACLAGNDRLRADDSVVLPAILAFELQRDVRDAEALAHQAIQISRMIALASLTRVSSRMCAESARAPVPIVHTCRS